MGVRTKVQHKVRQVAAQNLGAHGLNVKAQG